MRLLVMLAIVAFLVGSDAGRSMALWFGFRLATSLHSPMAQIREWIPLSRWALVHLSLTGVAILLLLYQIGFFLPVLFMVMIRLMRLPLADGTDSSGSIQLDDFMLTWWAGYLVVLIPVAWVLYGPEFALEDLLIALAISWPPVEAPGQRLKDTLTNVKLKLAATE